LRCKRFRKSPTTVQKPMKELVRCTASEQMKATTGAYPTALPFQSRKPIAIASSSTNSSQLASHYRVKSPSYELTCSDSVVWQSLQFDIATRLVRSSLCSKFRAPIKRRKAKFLPDAKPGANPSLEEIVGGRYFSVHMMQRRCAPSS
jgi:hypothetical protein